MEEDPIFFDFLNTATLESRIIVIIFVIIGEFEALMSQKRYARLWGSYTGNNLFVTGIVMKKNIYVCMCVYSCTCGAEFRAGLNQESRIIVFYIFFYFDFKRLFPRIGV